ncbi:MAG TPA: hypothetical protein PKW33_02790 [Anaerolineaceae bacterium]|nr:hypothetical protein [Anaerolineaceae bacterium]HPN50488.1 hypothetical protein [Anaerolineaceae bacterium]
MSIFFGATISCRRTVALDAFDQAHRQACWYALLRKMTGRAASHLQEYTLQPTNSQPERRFLGLQDISVEKITGSLNRAADFDEAFRPLKGHLRSRWADIYLQLREDRWPPVIVYKVGGQYFVEDGHHRVSVARSVGMAFIQAEVYEIPLRRMPQAQPAAVGVLQPETCC